MKDIATRIKTIPRFIKISIIVLLFIIAAYFLGIRYVEMLIGDYYENEVYERKTAYFWYRRAAEIDHPPALLKVGMRHNHTKKGMGYIIKSAELGYPEAQFELAEIYEKKRQYQDAFNWFKLSAENNYIYSYLKVAQYYHEGTRIKKNIPEAIKWYKKDAYDGAYLNSRYEYGLFLAEGKWIKQDIAEATRLIQDVIDQNYFVSNSELDKLKTLGVKLSVKK